MADKITPTPWGVLIDARTSEPIGPADRDQWAQNYGPFPEPLTLADGRQAHVTGGPEMNDCGHADREHIEDWRKSMEDAAALVVSDMGWRKTPKGEGSEQDVVIEDVESRTLLILTVLLSALNSKVGISTRSCVEFLSREGLIGAAGTLSGVELWVGGFPAAWDMIASRAHLVTPEEWGAILGLASFAADKAGMTADDVRKFAVSLVDDDDDTPEGSAS